MKTISLLIFALMFVSGTLCAERLNITSLRVSPIIVVGEPFDVSITAIDPIGVQQIEIFFERQFLVLPAYGVKIAVLTTELVGEIAAYQTIEAVAVGVDGTRGNVTSILVGIADHSSDTPADHFEEIEFSDNPLALYEPGPLYTRGFSTEAKLGKADAQRKQDALFDQHLLKHLHPWWETWKHSGGPQPFDWENYCVDVPGITPNGEVLECWLELNPGVRFALMWEEVNLETGEVDTLNYDEWDFLMRNYLNVTFYQYWQWLNSDLTQFNGPILVDPPINQVHLQVGQAAVTSFSRYDALNLYIQTVAHSLALEIGGFVPWSVLNYSFFDLVQLFSSHFIFHAGHFDAVTLSNPTPVVFNGWWPYGDITNSPPKRIFEFLVHENMIRMTHYDSISRVLKWSRETMKHSAGMLLAEDAYNHWQYSGSPPLRRILEGTPRLDPPGDVSSWMQGCHGVSFFFFHLLRGINIPVATTWIPNFGPPGGHRAPVFHTIDRTLSHGDDAYHIRIKNIPSIDPSYIPPDKIMISSDQFVQWFEPNNPMRYENIGRQVYEIALEILPNSLLDKHCDDLAAQLSHAASSVYQEFDKWYSVPSLEFSKQLWIRLNQKVNEHDYCP